VNLSIFRYQDMKLIGDKSDKYCLKARIVTALSHSFYVLLFYFYVLQRQCHPSEQIMGDSYQ
jgi:hypothetical protein